MASPRNHTISLSVEEGKKYLDRCISISDPVGHINHVQNRTICGDAFKILKLLPHNSVDLIIADPPYNLTKKYAGTTFSRMDDESYADWMEAWISLAAPLLKTTGTMYVCGDWQTSMTIAPCLQKHLKLQNRITWQREKGRGAKSNWKNGMEDIWFATAGNRYTFNLEAVKIRRKVKAPYRVDGKPKDWVEDPAGNWRDTCPSNFWDDITIPFWSMPENTAHPTQKPEKLIAKLILASSSEGDVVLDPFLGSGTTSVVAKKLKRRYIGIELEPQHCIWAERRLELAESNPSIQGFSEGVFWERGAL